MIKLVKNAVPGMVLSSASGPFYLVVFSYLDESKNQLHLGVLRNSKFSSFHFDLTCKFNINDSFEVV